MFDGESGSSSRSLSIHTIAANEGDKEIGASPNVASELEDDDEEDKLVEVEVPELGDGDDVTTTVGSSNRTVLFAGRLAAGSEADRAPASTTRRFFGELVEEECDPSPDIVILLKELPHVSRLALRF